MRKFALPVTLLLATLAATACKNIDPNSVYRKPGFDWTASDKGKILLVVESAPGRGPGGMDILQGILLGELTKKGYEVKTVPSEAELKDMDTASKARIDAELDAVPMKLTVLANRQVIANRVPTMVRVSPAAYNKKGQIIQDAVYAQQGTHMEYQTSCTIVANVIDTKTGDPLFGPLTYTANGLNRNDPSPDNAMKGAAMDIMEVFPSHIAEVKK